MKNTWSYGMFMLVAFLTQLGVMTKMGFVGDWGIPIISALGFFLMYRFFLDYRFFSNPLHKKLKYKFISNHPVEKLWFCGIGAIGILMANNGLLITGVSRVEIFSFAFLSILLYATLVNAVRVSLIDYKKTELKNILVSGVNEKCL